MGYWFINWNKYHSNVKILTQRRTGCGYKGTLCTILEICLKSKIILTKYMFLKNSVVTKSREVRIVRLTDYLVQPTAKH